MPFLEQEPESSLANFVNTHLHSLHEQVLYPVSSRLEAQVDPLL